jgi:Flp pilus assembly protein TadG
MLRCFIPFLRDRRGVAAVEFAFVAPVIFMMTIGTIDVGRLVWSWSSLHHMAREATRYASVRGAEATTPMTTDQLEDYVNNRLIGMDPNDVTVTVTWTPNNSPGSNVEVQLDYQFVFFLGGLVGMDSIQIEGESSMVVL